MGPGWAKTSVATRRALCLAARLLDVKGGTLARLRTVTLLALALGAGSARADDPPFVTIAQGAVLSVNAGASQVGDHLVGGLGVQSNGLRSSNRRWLLQWDALAVARGGWLANQHPYRLFVGARGHGSGELGLRLSPVGAVGRLEDLEVSSSAWSPYFGGRLDASIAAMTHPGVAFSALDTINNSDGFGGLTSSGFIRAVGGLSLLDDSKSLLLVGFVQ